MSITGSLVVFIIIWWVVFFSVLPIGIKSENAKFSENLEGFDKGAPKNPNIAKKFLITTTISVILFFGIYYIVDKEIFNLREFLDQ